MVVAVAIAVRVSPAIKYGFRLRRKYTVKPVPMMRIRIGIMGRLAPETDFFG